VSSFTLAVLAVSFATVVGLTIWKKNIALGLFAGSLVMGILAVRDLFLRVLAETLIDPLTWSLAAIMLMIGMLATLMKRNGQIKEILLGLEGVLSKRALLASIPAILGLLPVPGGALISAPLVKEKGEGLKAMDLFFINIWFRHMLVLIFPIASSFVLMSELAGVSIYRLLLYLLPMTGVTLFIGAAYLILRVGKSEKRNDRERGRIGILPFLPIAVPVALSIGLSFILPSYLAFLIALPVGIGLAMLNNGKLSHLREGVAFKLPLSIVGIFLFKNLVLASGAASEILALFSFVPPTLLVSLFPFIIGFLLGSAPGTIGLCYPVMADLIDGAGVAALFYISSFLGYMISPLHLCLALTYEYYRPEFRGYLLFLAASVAAAAIANLIYYFM